MAFIPHFTGNKFRDFGKSLASVLVTVSGWPVNHGALSPRVCGTVRASCRGVWSEYLFSYWALNSKCQLQALMIFSDIPRSHVRTYDSSRRKPLTAPVPAAAAGPSISTDFSLLSCSFPLCYRYSNASARGQSFQRGGYILSFISGR